MTIKQQGGIFGRNPAFNDVTVQGDVEVDGQLGVKTSSHWDASTGITAAGRIHTSDGTATGGFNYGNGTVINMGSMSSHPVQMIVGNSTKAIFETDGDLKIVSGNLVINTSGQGIDFSATSGTGTSELLDDYEEGSFTPAFDTTNSDLTSGYTTQTGSYTKIGNVVNCLGSITLSSVSGGTGALLITGLPYTVSDLRGGSTGFAYAWGTNYPVGYINSGAGIGLYYASSATAFAAMSSANLTSTTQLRFFVSYITS